MKPPKISVVIPVYNEEKRLPACLKAIKEQLFKDFEIVVVDNNSTDNSASIAKSFGAVVVKEPVQGMIAARNRGYDKARGEIIARTDADTIVPNNWLSLINDLFEKNPDAVALSGALSFPGARKGTHKFIQIFTLFINQYLSKALMGHFWLMGPNHALRRSAWEKIRHKVHLDDNAVHEDMDLSCCLYPIGDILYVPNLKIKISLRRWKKNFWYTLYDYTIRYFRTILIHHPFLKRHKMSK